MAKLALAFDVTAKDSGASKTFDKVGDAADRAGGKGEGFGSKFGKLAGSLPLAGAAVAGVVGGIAALSGAFINTSSDMEAVRAKSKTVFGDSLPLVEKWADKSANAMKLTQSEATGLATNFADLLIPMGFGRDTAAKMSTEVIGLSGALSKWSGGQRTSAEVADILSGAMLGEYDSLKSLGIGLSAAEVESVLLAKGQDKLTGAAKQQAEAIAVQELVMSKSVDAQKAYAEGNTTLRDKMELLRTKLREVWEQLVEKLTPAVTRFADWLQTEGIAKLQQFGEWLKANKQNFIDLGVSALEGSATILRGLAQMVDGALLGFGILLDAAVAAFGWVPGIGDKLKSANTAFDGMREVAVNALNTAAAQADVLAGKLDGLTVTRRVTVDYQEIGGLNPRQADRKERRLGGPVAAGEPYIVGDGGVPEVFVPSRRGTIVPKVPGGQSIVVNVAAAPGERAAETVPRALRNLSYTMGWA